jgi:hypothetical protein
MSLNGEFAVGRKTNGTHFVRIEPRAQAVTTGFIRETVTRLAHEAY